MFVMLGASQTRLPLCFRSGSGWILL